MDEYQLSKKRKCNPVPSAFPKVDVAGVVVRAVPCHGFTKIPQCRVPLSEAINKTIMRKQPCDFSSFGQEQQSNTLRQASARTWPVRSLTKTSKTPFGVGAAHQSNVHKTTIGPLKHGSSQAQMPSANKINQLEIERQQSQLEISRLIQKVSELEAENQQKQTALSHTQRLLGEREAVIIDLKATVQERENTILEMGKTLVRAELVRKKLHNSIQELKGNIRVYVRVRGHLPNCTRSPTPFDFPDSIDRRVIAVQSPVAPSHLGNGINKTSTFTLDKVFEPSCNQDDVFEEISQLVQSALDGYRVCVFAYGQTGSGKTFTMEGTPGEPGIIPRAVEQIFRAASQMKEKGWVFQLYASFLEIYMEDIRDLLVDPSTYERRTPGMASSSSCDSTSSEIKHEIHHAQDGNTIVTNLSSVEVADAAAVHRLLQTATRHRQTARTNMNERSSRSHSVFTLRLHGTNASTGESVNGLLNLIDLAGSERLAASGATGDRLKETQNINRSLSCLGDVAAALAQKKAHVPFRNSKLTFLLQNCLGGDCKTLMFVNVSPEPEHVSETLCSLRFATKMNNCEIGTAKRKIN